MILWRAEPFYFKNELDGTHQKVRDFEVPNGTYIG
jgi:hypothetical protein